MMDRLTERLRVYAPDGVLLAFSGGVDSTVLLAALATLRRTGDFPLQAVFFASVFQTEEEARAARERAGRLGVDFQAIPFDPLAIPGVVKNPPDRCYLCKHHVFSRLRERADVGGFGVLMDGTHAGDAQAYRPGRRALRELGVVSPLAECGFGKADVRALARQLGLDVADKPSAPCLATRFPYQTDLTPALIARVGEGERMLRKLLGDAGNLRVRDFGGTACIEVDPSVLARVVARREAVVAALKAAGFERVTMDLAGFRSGSLDG